MSSNPVIDTSSGALQAEDVHGLERAESELVGEAQQRRRALPTVEESDRRVAAGGRRVGDGLVDNDGGTSTAGRSDGVEHSRQSFASDSKVGGGDAFLGGNSGEAVRPDAEGEHTERAMTEGENVLGECAHRGPIADADEPLSVYFRTVDEHRRHLAAQHLADDRVTIVQRVDAEAVDNGAADPFSLILARRRGDEQERVAGCLRLAGERAEEFDVVRVGERPLERVREHDANRTGAPRRSVRATGFGPR